MTHDSISTSVTFGSHRIGPTEEIFIIAEAGVNHDGDVAVAHELIDLAADTGANAVKFQTFKPETLVTGSAGTTPYQKAAGFSESQSEMLGRLTLPESVWAELRDHSTERGVTFLSTPFDYDSALMLAELGVPGLKIGSGELTNTPYLAAIAEFGIPMIVSTGMGTREEIAAALEATAKAPATVLLHCVSAYPAPLEEANLRAIPALRQEFGVEVGWSDHTPGSVTAIAATALGSTLLEKHITTDKTRNGPDHSASLERQNSRTTCALSGRRTSHWGTARSGGCPVRKPTPHWCAAPSTPPATSRPAPSSRPTTLPSCAPKADCPRPPLWSGSRPSAPSLPVLP